MDSRILTGFRLISNTAICLVFAVQLLGCATSVAVDEEERNTLANASSVSMVLYPHDPFIVTTAVSQGLSTFFGGVVTAESDAQRGRDVIARHRLPDPSTLVIDYFSAGLEAAYGLQNLDDTPSLQLNNSVAALRNTLGGGLVFDFRTIYWRGYTQLNKKAIDANIQARLLDLSTGEVLWEQVCSGGAKGSGDLWEDLIEVNSVASDAAQDCTQELLQSFVEEANLPAALNGVEVAAANRKEELGEIAAEIREETKKRMENVSLIGRWKGFYYDNIQLDMSLNVSERNDVQFRGDTSITGSSVSCTQAKATLAPSTANEYYFNVSGGGCDGSGVLMYQGDRLTGRFRGKRIELTRTE